VEVIVKTTGRCNGTCVYCASSCPTSGEGGLQVEQLERFFAFFAPWFATERARHLRFIWHGGEPLLLGKAFYREVLRAQAAVFGPNRPKVRNTMQSNLTLLDEAWIPVLRELLDGETIGSSFDIVDGVRGLRSGEPLAAKWLPAVERLKANGIPWGVVYVVHKRSLGRAADLYWFFKNLNPRRRVRYNPLLGEGMGRDDDCRDLQITPEEYGQFLVELLDVWANDGFVGSPAPLAEFREAWGGREEALCCDYQGRCHTTHLGVDAGGDAFSCGRGSDRGMHRLGNVFRDGLDDVLTHAYWAQTDARYAKLEAGPCGACRWWRLCHGGCPLDATLQGGEFGAPTHFCAARKLIFARMEDLLGPSPLAQRAA
jgi:serine-type anaerobic sulfatase-maturating enzyme